MCGRYLLTTPPGVLATVFGLDTQGLPALTPRYNIAPGQQVPIVRYAKSPPLSEDWSGPSLELVLVRWGLAPGWASESDIGNPVTCIAAETLGGKPGLRAAFERRRCLIPADGFYEWKQTPGRRRQPYHITARPQNVRATSPTLFAMAGVWDRWEPQGDGSGGGGNGQVIETCAIVTTPSNEFMAGIHARMPAILRSDEWRRWLDPEEEPRKLRELCRPYPAHLHAAMAVGQRVNSPRNETPLCLEPAESEESPPGPFV